MEIIKKLSDNLRKAFRVKPTQEEPIYMEINGQQYKVEDISSTGLAIWDYPFKQPVVVEATIKLPKYPEVEARIKLFDQRFDITVGAFEEMSADDLLIIDKYVIDRQKDEIRRKKKARVVLEC